jgi:hypothetical protein
VSIAASFVRVLGITHALSVVAQVVGVMVDGTVRVVAAEATALEVPGAFQVNDCAVGGWCVEGMGVRVRSRGDGGLRG